jgi:hypothetical protein
MEIQCERCGYKTDKLANMKTHLNRKRTCQDSLKCGKSVQELLDIFNEDLPFACRCGEHFSSKQGLNQHKKLCTEKTSAAMKKVLDENKQLRADLDNVIAMVKDKSPCNIQVNNYNTVNNVNNITIVCNFGEEDVSYVIEDGQFLNGCMKELFSSGIESVVKKIYFDKEHPENHTIKMANIKKDQVMLKEDNEWVRKHLSGPAQKMIRKGKNILQTYYISSDEAKAAMQRMVEENDVTPDRKLEYLSKLGQPESNEHKIAISKVKGVLSNYKYEPNNNTAFDE